MPFDDDNQDRPFPMDRRAPREVASTESQMVLREISNVKELFNGRIWALEKEFRAAEDDRKRVPTNVDRAMKCLEEVMEQRFKLDGEKFLALDRIFAERDERHHHSVRDAKDSVEKAFSSLRELFTQEREAGDRAINKQELAFTRQIEAQGALLNQSKAELDKRLDELKNSITTIVAVQTGRTDSLKDNRDQVGMWLGVGGFVIGIFGVVAAFLARTAS